MSQYSPASLSYAKQQAKKFGFEIPPHPSPIAAYVPTRRVGDQVYISGQIPIQNGKLMAEGIVPTDVTLERATKCAQLCILNALAATYSALSDDEGIAQIVRIGCFVACTPGFVDHPKIANGASELLVEILGETGRHARAAVGCASLPINAPVEIEMLAVAGKLV